ncbi:hypothetical protein ACVWZV_007631 [Bradyrhizobium sp. GM5.1]
MRDRNQDNRIGAISQAKAATSIALGAPRMAR